MLALHAALPISQPTSERDHAAMGHGAPPEATEQQSGGMDHAAMGHTMPQGEEPAPAQQPMSGMDHAAMGHAMPPASADADPCYAPGSGLMPKAANGGKFLSYADLKSQRPLYEEREPKQIGRASGRERVGQY